MANSRCWVGTQGPWPEAGLKAGGWQGLRTKGGLPDGSTVKNPPTLQEMQEKQVRFLGQGEPLKEGMATHSSILDWSIPWTEEPGGLQSIGSQRIGHD